VVVHHATLGYLQDIGYSQVYFTQLDYFALQTFIIHVLLAAIVFFICGLWAYQLKKYNERQIVQTIQMTELQKEAQLSAERKKSAEALEERNTILESITDAFFAVDHHWTVTYWNNMAERELCTPKDKILNQNLWEVYADSVDSESYRKYHEAMQTGRVVHFEDFYEPLEKWYEISAYPSPNGLSVYFKDITGRKLSEFRLTESEKRYSELFHLSPLPMWVFDLDTLKFIDVNRAAINHYGYTREEFLSMTIKDIRPEEEIPLLEKAVKAQNANGPVHHAEVFRHKKKGGSIIQVDIQSTVIHHRGRKAKVVLANDITDQLNYIKAIEEQNKKLKEISWLQSHVVRAPLAKIIGLIPLITDVKEKDSEREKMLNYLLRSANELDEVVGHITDKTNIVEIS
jgi:PAS domain S-box-containing protein